LYYIIKVRVKNNEDLLNYQVAPDYDTKYNNIDFIILWYVTKR